METELIIHNKVIDEYGNTVEIKLWAVDKSSAKPHGYKYSEKGRSHMPLRASTN
jgi:hypothetical protein